MIHCGGMPAMPFPTVRLVKGAVILGLVTAVFGALAVAKLSMTRQEEILRYQACANGARQDCEPSLFWVLAGLATSDDGTFQTDLPTAAETGKRVVRTSEQAPHLTSLKPEGFISDNNGYQVTLGTKVDLVATVERAGRVEVRLRPMGAASTTLLQVMKPVTDKEDEYQASFTWNERQTGELEIFAVSPTVASETATLIIPLRVVEVANGA